MIKLLTELFCNNKIKFQKGFYKKENLPDGRAFYWMSKYGEIFVPNGVKAIKLNVCYPEKNGKQVLVIGRKQIEISEGWHVVYINVEDIHLEKNILSLRCLQEVKKDNLDDKRELCLMVCEPEIMLQEEYEGKNFYIIKNKDVKVLFRDTEFGKIEGIIYINASNEKNYLDFIVTSMGKNNILVNFSFYQVGNAKTVKAQTLSCGKRLLSVALPKKWNIVHFEADSCVSIENVVKRNDYCDYFGLSKYFTEKSNINRRACIEAGNSLGVHLVWFVTWACNYHCHYCWEEKNAEIYRQQLGRLNSIKPLAWAEAINRMAPDSVYLSGGEPTLYKYLPEVIEYVDDRTKFIMTSNGGPSFNPERYANFFRIGKFSKIGFSFHPSEVSLEDFLLKMDMCCKIGINEFVPFDIELVLYPTDFKYADKLLEYVKGKNILLKFDVWNDESAKEKYTTEQSKIMLELREKAFLWNDNINKSSNLFEKSGKDTVINNSEMSNIRGRDPVWCLAGNKQLHMDYAGDLYPCMSSIHRSKIFGANAMPHYGSIGNIFDNKINRLQEPIICWEAYRCSLCDYSVHGHTMRKCELKDCEFTSIVPE